MFFVEARYHRDPTRAGAQVRYIAHREEGLTDGRRRDLYGIGERYRALRGDEPAIRKALREDGRGLRNPPYFRFILTVDNPTAERFRRLDGYLSERVLRDAIERTFRGAARGAQGVFTVHQHGGQGRPAHPHVHALLSPRFENRMPVHISPVRIERVKERWEREVLAGLHRQERRLDRGRQALVPAPLPRQQDRDPERTHHLLPLRKASRRDAQPELFMTPRRSLRLVQGDAAMARWLRLGRRRAPWQQDPERAARRAVFRLFTSAIPMPMREAISLLRGLRALRAAAVGRNRSAEDRPSDPRSSDAEPSLAIRIPGVRSLVDECPHPVSARTSSRQPLRELSD